MKYSFSTYLGRLFLDFFSFLKNLELLPQYNMGHEIDSNTELKTMKVLINVSLIFQHNRHSTEYCFLIYILIKVSVGDLIAEHSEDHDFILFWKIPAAYVWCSRRNILKVFHYKAEKRPKMWIMYTQIVYIHTYICIHICIYIYMEYLSFHFNDSKMWRGDILVRIFAWLMHDCINCWIAQS